MSTRVQAALGLSLYAEGDGLVTIRLILSARFQSSPSVQRETQYRGVLFVQSYKFQSTPSTQRETTLALTSALLHRISILSLYTEGDSCL
nr:MAG TPA: hypothetical protein [Caudoviricetes sp.]